jgi:hypothetical protein
VEELVGLGTVLALPPEAEEKVAGQVLQGCLEVEVALGVAAVAIAVELEVVAGLCRDSAARAEPDFVVDYLE